MEAGSMNSGENKVMQKNEVQTLPARYGSGECDEDDVLDASDGDAHCRWCGAIIPATNYMCAVSGRCCSAVCQALYCGIPIPIKADNEIDGGWLRAALKGVHSDPPITVKEKLLPDWFVEEEKNQAEDEARDRVASLRSQAKVLGIGWPRDWRKAGWKSEKQFLTEIGARITARTTPVGQNSLPEAA